MRTGFTPSLALSAFLPSPPDTFLATTEMPLPHGGAATVGCANVFEETGCKKPLRLETAEGFL